VLGKTVRALLLALLALIPLHAALAKGPPDKITITGPGIAEPIKVTHSNRLYAFSFYQFNDLTRRIESPDISLSDGYHITRYIEDKGRLIVWDRLTYYLDPAGGPGFIFFDGLDPSIGSTEGQGEWFLSTEEGGAAMRQILSDYAPPSNIAPQTAPISPVAWLGALGLVGLLAAVGLRMRRARQTVAR
jgi:hypothetical protein